MQLSKSTIEILKNLATINPSIIIKPREGDGTILGSIAADRNLVGVFEVEENFDQELRIYDLSQFIAVLTSMDSPTLEATKDYVVVKSGRMSSKIYFAPEGTIREVNGKADMPKTVLSFRLTNDVLQKIMRMASTLQLSDIIIEASNGKVKILVTENKNSTSSNFDVIVDENYTGPDQKFYIKSELLKFIPGDYNARVGEQKITEFTTDDGKRTYYVALEQPKK